MNSVVQVSMLSQLHYGSCLIIVCRNKQYYQLFFGADSVYVKRSAIFMTSWSSYCYVFFFLRLGTAVLLLLMSSFRRRKDSISYLPPFFFLLTILCHFCFVDAYRVIDYLVQIWQTERFFADKSFQMQGKSLSKTLSSVFISFVAVFSWVKKLGSSVFQETYTRKELNS